MITATLIILIGVALLFDFLNGLHDAANSIATIVSTELTCEPSSAPSCTRAVASADRSPLAARNRPSSPRSSGGMPS